MLEESESEESRSDARSRPPVKPPKKRPILYDASAAGCERLVVLLIILWAACFVLAKFLDD